MRRQSWNVFTHVMVLLTAVEWDAAPARAQSPDFLTQQAYLKASNTDPEDVFGASIVVSGNTLVVGAEGEASGATGVNGDQTSNSSIQAGAAYVFVRDGATWTQQAYLKASNTNAVDFFGRSVSISGDTIVVGAPSESSAATGVNGNQNDSGAPFAGAAYVFVRTGTTWTQQAYLKASDTEENDFFGSTVAVSGDTIVVGATGADPGGAAYVFVRTGTTWSQQALLTASNAEAGDIFGEGVTVSADTIAVGAAGEDSTATGVNGNQADNTGFASGAVYVFVRSGTMWTQQAYIKASNTDDSDAFGEAVALDGETLVVGSLGESSNATGVNGDQSDNSADRAGAAYVFVRDGTTWSQQAYLKASNTELEDFFGASAAISQNTILVGAYNEGSAARGVNGDQGDNSAPGSGAAYLFSRTGTTWTQAAYLKASNTDIDDNFGFSAALSPGTVVVGAPHEASNATGVNGNQANNDAVFAGAVYVFGPGAVGVPALGTLGLVLLTLLLVARALVMLSGGDRPRTSASA